MSSNSERNKTLERVEFAAGKKPEKRVNGSKKSKPVPEPIAEKPDQFQKCNTCEHSWKNQVGRTPFANYIGVQISRQRFGLR